MKKERFKISLFNITFIVFAIGSIFWPFTKITGISTFYPSLALIIVYVFIYRINILFKWSVISTLLLYIVLIMYDVLGHFRDVKEVHLYPFGVFNFVFPFFLSAVVIELLIANKDSNALYFFGRFSLYIIVFTSIMSIIYEIMNPTGARVVMQDDMGNYIVNFTFSGIYGLSFVMSGIVGIRKKIDVSDVIIYGLFVTALLMSAFLTNIVFALGLVLMAIIFRINPKNIFIYIIVMICVLLFIISNVGVLVDLLPQLPGANKSDYALKAMQIADISQYHDKGAILLIRQEVYALSYESFIKNMFFGSGSWESIAEHSFWLDKLGFIGLFGSSFFLFSIYMIYKRSVSIIDIEHRGLYRIIIATLLLLLFFNPFYDKEFWLIIFVYTPLIMVYYINRARIS